MDSAVTAITDRKYAIDLDKSDPLRDFHDQFVVSDPATCYLDGNSLGRLPVNTVAAVNDFLLKEWGEEIVGGWGHWIEDAQQTGDLIGRSTLGAGSGQVIACDTTSINFYQLVGAVISAKPTRKTIITDAANFPTDRYILQGYAEKFGLTLVMLNNETPDAADCERITPEILEPYLSDDVALVALQVVQYRSGSRTDMKVITDLARKHGALVVWDASHAIGAVNMNFDVDSIDLAVGCTYKYCNSGPGAPGWLFVSKALQSELHVPIQGWFAQKDQFSMGGAFERAAGIRGFLVGTPPIMGLRCIQSAFTMIEEAGIEAIATKCRVGTEMMIALYDAWLADLGFVLATPRNATERGGHVTLIHPEARRISIALRRFANVIPDYRVPDSIRLAISPLPTSFVEVWDGFYRLRELVLKRDYEKVGAEEVRVT